MEAAFRKYPNPYSAHVHSLDTIQRRVSASGRRLYSHRLFCTMWNIPTIVLKVIKPSFMFIVMMYLTDSGRQHSDASQ